MSPEKITSSMRSFQLQNKHLVSYTHKTIAKFKQKKIEKKKLKNIDIFIQRRLKNDSKNKRKNKNKRIGSIFRK